MRLLLRIMMIAADGTEGERMMIVSWRSDETDAAPADGSDDETAAVLFAWGC